MVAYGLESTLQLQASTGKAGYTLVNGTGTVISWTAPDDGQLHRAILVYNVNVTSAETGGDITVNATLPDGTSIGYTIMPGGQGTGFNFGAAPETSLFVQAGTSVIISQFTALTSGAATLWAEIWGR